MLTQTIEYKMNNSSYIKKFWYLENCIDITWKPNRSVMSLMEDKLTLLEIYLKDFLQTSNTFTEDMSTFKYSASSSTFEEFYWL